MSNLWRFEHTADDSIFQFAIRQSKTIMLSLVFCPAESDVRAAWVPPKAAGLMPATDAGWFTHAKSSSSSSTKHQPQFSPGSMDFMIGCLAE